MLKRVFVCLCSLTITAFLFLVANAPILNGYIINYEVYLDSSSNSEKIINASPDEIIFGKKGEGAYIELKSFDLQAF